METKSNNLEKKATILVVDDNPQNLQVLGRLLQERNFEIEFATNGETVLDWIKSQLFDLILLDINMPVMDGFEVCRRIRMDERFNNVPIIFLSADSERESILKGFEMGAQDYVTKPFDSRELLVRVQTHLTLKESLEKIEKVNQVLEEKIAERTQQLQNANSELEIVNKKLKALDNAKSEFLNLISHEIRTPLNGIAGFLQLVKEPLLKSNFGVHFKALDSSVKRLESFALNALLITELKTRSGKLDKTPMDIVFCIDGVVELLQNKIDNKHLTMRWNYNTEQTILNGDQNLISRCLLNILDNAITYSPADNIIEIGTSTDDNFMIITIDDNGEGIPDKILESNFELFSTAGIYRDNALGVGIPLAKIITDLHGGSIEMLNKTSGGARVTLKFPRN